MRGRTFGASALTRPRINLLRLEEELAEVHLRLSRATIEHLPWRGFITTYDKPETFFFFDPPHYKTPYYWHNFDIAVFEELARVLAGVKAHFALSINDHLKVRRVFSDIPSVFITPCD